MKRTINLEMSNNKRLALTKRLKEKQQLNRNCKPQSLDKNKGCVKIDSL